MKNSIRQNIDVSKCNAYSGTAYLYAAISVEERPAFATHKASTTDREVSGNKKGGIIVFSQNVNVDQQYGRTAIDMTMQKQNMVGWTIGYFFKGRYTGKHGEEYSEGSISVEIIGISDDTLMEVAEELCRVFEQKTAMVKVYSERNRILFVDGK